MIFRRHESFHIFCPMTPQPAFYFFKAGRGKLHFPRAAPPLHERSGVGRGQGVGLSRGHSALKFGMTHAGRSKLTPAVSVLDRIKVPLRGEAVGWNIQIQVFAPHRTDAIGRRKDEIHMTHPV
jgi:hypothetical protein